MSLDRAVMLPHEFDKKKENLPIGGHGTETVEVLRSPTKNTVERTQEAGEHAREITTEKY